MINFFHIGSRVEEIQDISPSRSEDFPTAVRFKSGATITMTGDWKTNVKEINQKLVEIERFRAQLDHAREQRLNDLKRLEEALRSFDRSAVSPEDLASLRNWCKGGRNYLHANEKASLKRTLGGFDE